MNTAQAFPARKNTAGLIQKQMAGELMLFDPGSKKTFCLNQSAAIVWQNSDGRTSVEQLANLVAAQTAMPADIRVVEFALRKLDEYGLMEQITPPTTGDANLGRRQLFIRLGWAAALLIAMPLVTTVKPPKAYAASGGTPTF